MRINPEEGTKCTAKTGVSRKTRETVKRKITVINNILPSPADRVRVEEPGLGETLVSSTCTF